MISTVGWDLLSKAQIETLTHRGWYLFSNMVAAFCFPLLRFLFLDPQRKGDRDGGVIRGERRGGVYESLRGGDGNTP